MRAFIIKDRSKYKLRLILDYGEGSDILLGNDEITDFICWSTNSIPNSEMFDMIHGKFTAKTIERVLRFNSYPYGLTIYREAVVSDWWEVWDVPDSY